MGYLGVKTLVASLRGETVEKDIDTGCELVTLENFNEPETIDLITPPLDKYLN